MREIKFRGLTKEGKWVYGYYCKIDRKHFIIPKSAKRGFFLHLPTSNATGAITGFTEVLPETVGEFTGLKDKNGKEIYESDVVTLSYGIPPKVDTLVIEYADDEVVADISVSGWWMRNVRPNGCSASLCKTYENDLEVIGSIHQNPELLKNE